MSPTMRPRTLTLLCPLGAVGTTGLLAIGVVHVLRDDVYEGRPIDRIGVALILSAIGIAITWLMIALARTKFEVGPEALVVRNVFRTHTVPLADVRGLAATRGGDWAKLRLATGQEITVMALSVGARWTLARRLDDLNRRMGWSSVR